MFKKLFSMAILTAMFFALGATAPVMATGADTNVVYTFAESEAYRSGTAAIADKDDLPDIMPHSGDAYLVMPGANDYLMFEFNVPEGGDDANYILSFYAKTSVGKSLCVETVAYVKEENKKWADYRKEKGLPYLEINNLEGMSFLNTGVQGEKGGEWLENRLEFRAPEGCDVIKIYFNVHFNNYYWADMAYASYINKEDAYRAIDTITIEKAPYNLLKNGDFESKGYNADGSVAMPYKSWDGSGNISLKKDENSNTYMDFRQVGSAGTQNASLTETVYLYEGEYLLSMDVSMENSRGTTIVRFTKGTTLDGTELNGANATENTLMDNQTLALRTAADNTSAKTRSYSSYFSVKTPAAYTFAIGNGWYGGDFTFDNIKIVPVETGHLQFGEVTYSATDTKNVGYGVGDFHFEYIPTKNVNAGDKVRAFGHAVVKTVGDTANVLTSVYKVTSGGNRVLTEVKIDTAEAGKIFTGTEVTIPTLASGETVEVKAMVLNSLGELKAFGKEFVLE